MLCVPPPRGQGAVQGWLTWRHEAPSLPDPDLGQRCEAPGDAEGSAAATPQPRVPGPHPSPGTLRLLPECD